MDLSSSSPSYSSSLNTPLVPGYYVEEGSNSSMDAYPPSPRFGGDYAVLELDDTREFEAPDMVGEAQAVPAKQGAESGFPQDEEDDWSNDGGLLSQVIDMQDRVEQRQQEDLLLQQQQQQQQTSAEGRSDYQSNCNHAYPGLKDYLVYCSNNNNNNNNNNMHSSKYIMT